LKDKVSVHLFWPDALLIVRSREWHTEERQVAAWGRVRFVPSKDNYMQWRLLCTLVFFCWHNLCIWYWKSDPQCFTNKP